MQSSIRSALLRAPLIRATLPVSFRAASSTSTPPPTPAVKANALIEALPGNSLVSKTGWITLTTAISAAAISNELFVLNEEVVVLGSFVIFAGYVSTLVREPYRDWADSQIKKVTEILNVSRAAHTSAVESRISTVSETKDIEALTLSLFELSKQTAALEHSSFALLQKSQVASEIKSVLDSWVRHEAQIREAEQRELVSSVLASVNAGLTDKKMQREILIGAVAEIESLVKTKAI